MKAHTIATLVSLLIIAIALTAVSSVTYSWWSDSENTDVPVDTGELGVEVTDIEYSVKSGSSGYFTIDPPSTDDDSTVYSGTTASLSYITAISNLAPNDVYYIDYTVKFSTTVYAAYMVDVSSNVNWISVDMMNVGDNTAVSDEWTFLPSATTPLDGTAHTYTMSVRIIITVADNAEQNQDASIEITNEITQSGNVPDNQVDPAVDDNDIVDRNNIVRADKIAAVHSNSSGATEVL